MSEEQQPTTAPDTTVPLRVIRPAIRRILKSDNHMDVIVQILLSLMVGIGCYFIIEPFLTAIVLAAILAVVTWPLYVHARSSMAGATTMPALLMVGLLIVVVLIPLSFLLIAVAQQIPKAVAIGREWIASGFSMPDWIVDIPVVGSWLHEQLLFALDPASLAPTLQKILEPVTSWVLHAAVNVSNGLFQLCLVTFIVFFFYRDGPWFADRCRDLMERVSGDLSHELTNILVNTTRSVVFGLVGTALGQAVVASIGFWIADVPGVLMLSFLVFVLSVVPIGPPLIWGPTAIWLYSTGDIGMAVFLALWGTFAVSSVDNFLKPLLISRGASLPLALVFLGVFGGVIAFGFLGLILGPILLAIGLAMLKAWLRSPDISDDKSLPKT